MAMAKSFARAERSSRLLDKGLREHIPSRIRKYREKVTIYDPLYSTVCQWQNFGPLAQVIARASTRGKSRLGTSGLESGLELDGGPPSPSASRVAAKWAPRRCKAA